MRILLFTLLLAPSLSAAEPLAAARQRLQRGNYVEAHAAFADLLKADAKNAPAAIGLADAARAVGEYGKALDALDAALKDNPDDPDLLAHRGDLLYSLGRWDDARADAKAATAKNDGHFLARWVRARLLRDAGDTDAAAAEVRWFVRAYSEASDKDRDITDPETLAIIGQAAAEHARWNNLSKQFTFILEEVYGEVAKKNPDFWQAENLAGRMLLEKYNKADAEDAFDKALKVNPRAADALVGKGLLCLQTYELKEAERHAERALADEPAAPRGAAAAGRRSTWRRATFPPPCGTWRRPGRQPA